MVLEVDGSVLEGGGQVLRMSIALSVLQCLPVHIKRIRAGRSKPGLAAQHLKGVELVQQLCNAKLLGAEIGSTEITFKPQNLRSGEFSADIKTAGSVGLLLQVSLPCLIFGDGPSSLTLKGGTNAEMAPQIEYITNVFTPMVQKFGVHFNCDVIKRGFFPAGKGVVKVKIDAIKKLDNVNLVDFGQVTHIDGESFVAGVLPFKMAEEMARVAENVLKKSLNVRISIKARKLTQDEAFGNGSGINLVASTTSGCFLGGSSLGRRGIGNDEVGRKAAEELLESVNRRVCADQRMQDQLIIYMALAGGKSRLKTGPITLHTETAIHVAELLTAAKFSITRLDDDCNIIECNGVGYQGKLAD